MPKASSTLAALRSLVAAWNPPDRRACEGVPTGVPAIDSALGGGLPGGQLTELVVAPGSGGQLTLVQLFETTRSARQRVALIDATDAFAPEVVAADLLRHLVWARCHNTEEAFKVADVLVRDGNYAAVVLDLRDAPGSALNRIPKTTWHRLHRITERQPAAVLVLSRYGLVPAVRWRLELPSRFRLSEQRRPRLELITALHAEALRGTFTEEMAG